MERRGAKLRVDRDADVAGRVNERIPYVIDQHGALPAVLPEPGKFPCKPLGAAQRLAAGEERLGKLARDPHRFLAGQVAVLALFFERDARIVHIVKPDAVFCALLDARDLLMIRAVVGIVKIETADKVAAVGTDVRIRPEQGAQPVFQKLRLPQGDDVFDLVAFDLCHSAPPFTRWPSPAWGRRIPASRSR